MPASTKKYHTLAIGVTGGIGSGKSEVCKIFASLGAIVHSADAIAKILMEYSPEIRKKLQKIFGENIYLPNGTLDRKQIAKLAFHDSELHEKLNAAVHPFVLQKIEEDIRREKKQGKFPMIVVEAALFYEAGGERFFDYMIVVDADEEKRIARVMKRDNSVRADVVARMQRQIPTKEKVARADFVIDTSNDRTPLRDKCSLIFTLLMNVARPPSQESI